MTMEKRTELSEIGEFGLIEKIQNSTVQQNDSVIKGIGDDAAVIEKDEHNYTLISTDMLVEGVHFDLTFCPLKHLGYKAVAVNLSDIYAMGGIAENITISIAISNRFSLEAIDELYTGILLACEKYKVNLIGGDTTSSLSGLVINITATGTVAKNAIIYRNGAQNTDLVCVSGDLGAAYMGLQHLLREKQVFMSDPQMQPEINENDSYILERQLKPEPRKDIIEQIKKLGLKPTAMIDISDGLASEILHICNQSKKGARIYEEKLPIDPNTYEKAREFNLDPTTVMLNGGEDYELLFTVPLAQHDLLRNNPYINIIGHITNADEGVQLVTKQDNLHPISAQGWQHFTK